LGYAISKAVSKADFTAPSCQAYKPKSYPVELRRRSPIITNTHLAFRRSQTSSPMGNRTCFTKQIGARTSNRFLLACFFYILLCWALAATWDITEKAALKIGKVFCFNAREGQAIHTTMAGH